MSEVLRSGHISSIDYVNGTAKVVYKDRDNAVSPDMPFLSTTFDMPEVDDLVLVLHVPNGTTSGLILGVPYSESKKPPEGIKGVWRKDFNDGSFIKYDYGSKELSISGNMEVDKLTVNGNLHVKGNLTVDGSYPT